MRWISMFRKVATDFCIEASGQIRAKKELEGLIKELSVKLACFITCQAGFSTVAYINAKTTASIDTKKERKKRTTTATVQVAEDTAHPDLYQLLQKWRTEKAAELELLPYRIFANRTLFGLVESLPTTEKTLKRVKGIGPAKFEEFGEAILEIIRGYCAGKDIPTDLLVNLKAEPKKKEPKPKSSTVSLALFEEGKSIAEIAAERGLVTGTIESHLTEYIKSGELDIARVLPSDKILEIEQYLGSHQTSSMGEVKAHFGDKFSYSELRMVWVDVERRATQSKAADDAD